MTIGCIQSAQEFRRVLEKVPDLNARMDRLCELNVIRQVRNVAADVFVREAWARGQQLSVHGWARLRMVW